MGVLWGQEQRGEGARLPQGVPGSKDLVRALTFPSLSCDPENLSPQSLFSLSVLDSLSLLLMVIVASELSSCRIISLSPSG